MKLTASGSELEVRCTSVLRLKEGPHAIELSGSKTSLLVALGVATSRQTMRETVR